MDSRDKLMTHQSEVSSLFVNLCTVMSKFGLSTQTGRVELWVLFLKARFWQLQFWCADPDRFTFHYWLHLFYSSSYTSQTALCFGHVEYFICRTVTQQSHVKLEAAYVITEWLCYHWNGCVPSTFTAVITERYNAQVCLRITLFDVFRFQLDSILHNCNLLLLSKLITISKQ